LQHLLRFLLTTWLVSSQPTVIDLLSGLAAVRSSTVPNGSIDERISECRLAAPGGISVGAGSDSIILAGAQCHGKRSYGRYNRSAVELSNLWSDGRNHER